MLDVTEQELFPDSDYLGQEVSKAQSRRKPLSNSDGAMYLATNHISDNYIQLIRKHVLPNLTLNPGLKIREISVLACMYKYKFPLQASDVSRLICEDPSTVSRAVQKLRAENMVHKLDCRDDARAHILVFTEGGRALAAEFNEKAYMVCKHLSGFTNNQLSHEDVEEFLRLAERIKSYSSELASFPPRLTKGLFGSPA